MHQIVTNSTIEHMTPFGRWLKTIQIT